MIAVGRVRDGIEPILARQKFSADNVYLSSEQAYERELVDALFLLGQIDQAVRYSSEVFRDSEKISKPNTIKTALPALREATFSQASQQMPQLNSERRPLFKVLEPVAKKSTSGKNAQL